MKTVTGYYSLKSYRIELDGEPIYYAGNHAQDSQGYVEATSRCALNLRSMRKFCLSTAKEMAHEHGASFGGIERDEDCSGKAKVTR